MNDIRTLKFAILRTIEKSSNKRSHKYNLLGRGRNQGTLERSLNMNFESEDRAQADKAFEELKRDKSSLGS